MAASSLYYAMMIFYYATIRELRRYADDAHDYFHARHYAIRRHFMALLRLLIYA